MSPDQRPPTSAHAMRFDAVDEQRSAPDLVNSMVAADGHPSIRVLREWTTTQLGDLAGARVVDVGCGPGTVAAQLAAVVGPMGRVTGIDTSTAMIEQARREWSSLPGLEFVVGDATRLDAANDSVDAYRSERTYQHLVDPEQALAEACRVVRPGGRIALIDTDWGTLAVDHPDRELTERLAGAPRRFPLNSWSGRRLLSQMRRAGLLELEVRVESLVATSWNPDTEPGVAGLPPFAAVAENARTAGILDDAGAAGWLRALEEEARADRFFLMLSMVAVAGTVPTP